MIGEIHILGLYAPAALVSAILGGLLVLLVRQVFLRIGFYRFVWHPGLFDLALFIALWAAASIAVDRLPLNHMVLSW